jgi:hypothetical protein
LSVESAPGAEQCPQRTALERRVEDILRRPLHPTLGASALSIDVQFERSSDGTFVAHVAATGPKPGLRLLRDSSPTCDALGEAVSVAIALLLDSALNEADSRATGPKSEGKKPPSPAAPSPDARGGRVEHGSEPPAWRGRASLEAGGGYGLGGAGALLAFGRLGVRHRGWLFDLAVAGNLPAERGFAGGSVRTSLVFGSLRACYLLGHAFSIAPCLQLGAGRLHGEGTGYGRIQASSLPWTAGGLGLVAEAPVSSGVFATFGASLWVPTRRQTFSVENAGIAWESKPVAGVLTAGLGLLLL